MEKEVQLFFPQSKILILIGNIFFDVGILSVSFRTRSEVDCHPKNRNPLWLIRSSNWDRLEWWSIINFGHPPKVSFFRNDSNVEVPNSEDVHWPFNHQPPWPKIGELLPFQQLQVLLTLFSESFWSFPHGTCSLSASHPLFSLRWGIPPRKVQKMGIFRVPKSCIPIPSGCTFKQPDSPTASAASESSRGLCLFPEKN